RGPAERGGRPRRVEAPLAGGAQRHGPARPRGAGAAPLRAAQLGRNRADDGDHRRGGQQALRPRPEATQDDFERPARRPAGDAAMTDPNLALDPVAVLAGEFAERYRLGERPSLTEYTDRYPELAEQIRELFPALVVMEELGSVEGAGPPLVTTSSLGKVPEQLGDFRLLREVGRGGMGVVYEAVQESLGRHVALKVLPAHGLMPPTHLERFRLEARAAARLHHTNIVPVH